MNSGSSEKYQGNHTFSKTPSVAQIASYVVFLSESIIFYLIVVPMYQTESLKVTLIALFSVTLAALIAITLKTGLNDPSDSLMIDYKNGNRDKVLQYRMQNPDKLLFCDHCQSYVKDESRHCRVCNTQSIIDRLNQAFRCTQNFDHHCQWINSCIGQKNYREFFVMIIVTWLNLSVYLAAASLATYDRSLQEASTADLIGIWIVGAVVLIFWFLISNLIMLHIYLWKKQITTYQFIILQREQQRAEERRKEEQRQLEIERQRQKQQKQKNNSTQLSLRHKTRAIQVNQSNGIVSTQNQNKFPHSQNERTHPIGTEKTIKVDSSKHIIEQNSESALMDHKQGNKNAKIQSYKHEDEEQIRIPKSENSKEIFLTHKKEGATALKDQSMVNSSNENYNKKTDFPQKNIFGERELTEKSEQINMKDVRPSKNMEMSSVQSQVDENNYSSVMHKNQSLASGKSMRKSSLGSIKLSQFFVKNNSFNMIIGKNDYVEPVEDVNKTMQLDHQISQNNASFAEGVRRNQMAESLNIKSDVQNSGNAKVKDDPRKKLEKIISNKV